MGWGVVISDGARLSWIAHGVIAPPETAARFRTSCCALLDGLDEIIALHAPHEAAVEEVFVNMNPSSTLKLGHARACALLSPARAGLPVAEYATRLVKKAVVGTGGADKSQITFNGTPPCCPPAGEVSADAADALAVAITHAHLRAHAAKTAHRGAA